jgi:hypothetical protein
MLSCVIAGVLCGALSASLSLSLYKVEDLFGKLPVHWMWWPAIGGLAVGIGGYFEPRALGVGYDVIGDLLHNHLALGVVAALLAVKAVIWVISLGSGTSGGVLAPLLMMGAGLGAVLSHVLPGNDPMLWPLVCMAATLGGVMRAPLTATIFAFGLTHDSNALLPLLAASAVAYGFTVLTMRRSILTEKIARRGYHIYREYGIDPLERHSVEEVMTREVRSIDAAMPVAQALHAHFGEGQAHRAFPVLRNGAVIGMADRAMLAAHGAGDPIATVGDACAGVPLFYPAGRELPRGRHAHGAPPARAPAGGERRAVARAGRPRRAQRPHQALARALRRRRKARAHARVALAVELAKLRTPPAPPCPAPCRSR